MAYVFQYGSNADIERINSEERLKGDARFVTIAYTEENFELDFTVWSEQNECAAADIISGKGRNIYGILYDIPDYLIRRDTACNRKSLDAIEANYIREKINVIDEKGKIYNVITYIGKKRQRNKKTSFDYVSHIIKGLRLRKVKNVYIEYVKDRIIANYPDLKFQIEKFDKEVC